MDQDTVDKLARLVGSGQSRRRILKTLAGGAVASVTVAIGLDRAGAARLRSVGNSCNVNADCASGLCVQEARTRKICHCQAAGDCPNTDLCHPTVCSSGACVAGTPVICPTPDQCHTAGTCNPSTGVCSNPTKPKGAVCNDGNACTQVDTCANGNCIGGGHKECAASDQCHTAGTCNPATGVCSNPAKADGSSCSDNNACTGPDACVSGVCTPGAAVICHAPDQCHEAGVCNTTTGQCEFTAKANGTACDDGNASTCNDVCTDGTCAGTPVNLQTDVTNCGSCAHRCSSGQNCASGICCTPESRATTCASSCGLTVTNNCGQQVNCTGFPCAGGGTCVNGTCQAVSGSCTTATACIAQITCPSTCSAAALCDTTAEGSTLCIDYTGLTSCSGLVTCSNSAICPAGDVCIPNKCCGSVCVPACGYGTAQGASVRSASTGGAPLNPDR